jgi:hypothetical protein
MRLQVFCSLTSNWQMFRVWNALFLFLPLHRVTIYEWLGKLTAEQKALSWPMWPFRLWQIEICYVYLGAGFGKLASERWQNGEAMYHVSKKKKKKISRMTQSPAKSHDAHLVHIIR